MAIRRASRHLGPAGGAGRGAGFPRGPGRHPRGLDWAAAQPPDLPWVVTVPGDCPFLPPISWPGYVGAAPFQPIDRRRAETAGTWLGAMDRSLCQWPLPAPRSRCSGQGGGGSSAWPGSWDWRPTAAAWRWRSSSHVMNHTALASAVWSAYCMCSSLSLERGAGCAGRRYRSRPRSRPEWDGDRFAWLRNVESDLLRRRCSVRMSEVSDSWDLKVAAGPFVSGRITAAVTYGRLPQASARFRAHPLYWIATAGSIVLGALAGGWAWVFPLLVQVVAGSEFLTLRTRLHRALSQTAAEAEL